MARVGHFQIEKGKPMKSSLLAGVALAGLVGLGPAMAGNIVLTGHEHMPDQQSQHQ